MEREDDDEHDYGGNGYDCQDPWCPVCASNPYGDGLDVDEPDLWDDASDDEGTSEDDQD